MSLVSTIIIKFKILKTPRTQVLAALKIVIVLLEVSVISGAIVILIIAQLEGRGVAVSMGNVKI